MPMFIDAPSGERPPKPKMLLGVEAAEGREEAMA